MEAQQVYIFGHDESLDRKRKKYRRRNNHLLGNDLHKSVQIRKITREKDGSLKKHYKSTETPEATTVRERRGISRTNLEQTREERVRTKLEEKKIVGSEDLEKKNSVEEIEILHEIKRVNGVTPNNRKKEHPPMINEQYITTKQGQHPCKDCLKWKIQLQHENKIVRTLTMEIMNLKTERDSWSNLYKVKSSTI